MAEVTLTISGRNYRMGCEDGQEDHLRALSTLLDGQVSEMRAKFGDIGELRLIVTAAIVIADQLSDARRHLEMLQAEPAGARSDRALHSPAQFDEAELADTFTSIAVRLERVAALLREPEADEREAGAARKQGGT